MEGSLSINQCLMILNALPNIGPCIFKSLLHYFPDMRSIFGANLSELKMIPGIGSVIADSVINHRKLFSLEREEERLRVLRGDFIGQCSEKFPANLRQIYDAPIGLYCLGDLCNGMPKIAIVGSRRATAYGVMSARKLAIELVEHGFCVVSGMARGIDSSAHEGALDAGGKTLAVFGNGVDVIYPNENARLYRQIIASGAVVSEFMLGRHADRQTFPMRNRIIAGLCEAVIIVESDIHGGGMITAKHALEQGRHIFAVPGHIDERSSAGCLELIRSGASLIRNVDDIFYELPYLKEKGQETLNFQEQKHDIGSVSCPIGKKICATLSALGPADVEALSSANELPIDAVAASLQMLELYGYVERLYDGKVCVRR
ncbi:MAG: DNA-processing protein DprA [Puniceicoccales bacterium]|nr:DNA-processing protein DprA [Puniceicoccales bacterium]